MFELTMDPVEMNADNPLGSESHRIRLIRFVLLFLLIPFSIPTIFFVNRGLSSVEVSVVDQFGDVSPSEVGTDEDSVNLYFQAVSFDPESQTAEFRIYPWPSADIADNYSSSSILKEFPIRIWSDGITGDNFLLFEEFESIGGITQYFDVISYGYESRANDALYPFDSYVLDTYAWAEIDKTPENNKDDFEGANSFDFFYTTPVPGFHTSYKRVAGFTIEPSESRYAANLIKKQRAEGLISFEVKFERSTAVKTISLIIGIFCVISAITLTWITAGIWFRRRPPSMQALVWSAASVLGTIQLRDILPGNPRIGISMDFLFFFPSLLIGLISSLLITGIWISRDDWEI
jgi:hypothetical protein